jgi:hypothetical protein
MALYQPLQLFNIQLYDCMIAFSEMEGIEDEVVMAYFEGLSWNSPVGSEENYGKDQSA